MGRFHGAAVFVMAIGLAFMGVFWSKAGVAVRGGKSNGRLDSFLTALKALLDSSALMSVHAHCAIVLDSIIKSMWGRELNCARAGKGASTKSDHVSSVSSSD